MPSRCGRTTTPCNTGNCGYNQTSNKHFCVCPTGVGGDTCQEGKLRSIIFTSVGQHVHNTSRHAISCFIFFTLLSDIDECSTGQHNCDVPDRATCDNTRGSFLCHCRHGYCGEDGQVCKGMSWNKNTLTFWVWCWYRCTLSLTLFSVLSVCNSCPIFLSTIQ